MLPDVGTYPCNSSTYSGASSECGPNRGGDEWYNNTIDQFSAACWYFAEELTDIAESKNESVVPFGLIESNWGGTMVEMPVKKMDQFIDSECARGKL